MKVSASKLKKLETFLAAHHFKVRYEKGHFRSGYCLIKERKMILINKFFDRAGRYHKLLQILAELQDELQLTKSDQALVSDWLSQLDPLHKASMS